MFLVLQGTRTNFKRLFRVVPVEVLRTNIYVEQLVTIVVDVSWLYVTESNLK